MLHYSHSAVPNPFSCAGIKTTKTENTELLAQHV